MRTEFFYCCVVMIATILIQNVFAQEHDVIDPTTGANIVMPDSGHDVLHASEENASISHKGHAVADKKISDVKNSTTVSNAVVSKEVVPSAQQEYVTNTGADVVVASGNDGGAHTTSASMDGETVTGVMINNDRDVNAAGNKHRSSEKSIETVSDRDVGGGMKDTSKTVKRRHSIDSSKKNAGVTIHDTSGGDMEGLKVMQPQHDHVTKSGDDASDDACVLYSDRVRIAFLSIGDTMSSRNDIIALRNDADTCVSLRYYKLRKLYNGMHKGVPIVKNVSIASSFTQNDTIAPGTLFYWTYKKSRFAKRASIVNTKTLSDNTAVALIFDDGNHMEVIDTIAWGDAPTNGSILQDGLVLRNRVRNPTKQEYITRNSGRAYIAQQCMHTLLRTDPCVQPYSGQKVVINEVLPNPSGNERAGEYIELFNPGTKTVNLYGWVIGDASTSGRYRFPRNTEIAPRGYYVVTRQMFGFALNNSHESVTLWAPGTEVPVVVDTLRYERSAPEDVSLNRTDNGLYRWSKYRTPGARNIFNNAPIITSLAIDKKVFKNIAAHFSVRAKDGDGEALSYRWDFGDGHRSYKRNATHTYTKTGYYTVSLRVGDGSEDVVRTVSLAVHKYPRTKNIKITAIAPNPDGPDKDVEYLIIKNTDKKNINLRKWSIATGSDRKKMVNHPMRRKIVLRAGKEKQIFAHHAAITLPNKGGVVELRRPDGSVAQRVTYKTPDGYKSIPVNAVYRKRLKRNGGGWAWSIPLQKTQKALQKKHVVKQDKTVIERIITRAWRNEFAQQRLSSTVRNATATRISHASTPWYNHLGSAVNARITFMVEKILRVIHRGTRSDNSLQYVTIDRAAVTGITGIHPAVVALSLTGLLPQSPSELAHSEASMLFK